MKYIARWQFFCFIALLIVAEILSPIINGIANKSFHIFYPIIFLVVVYALAGAIISLSKIKTGARLRLNYKKMIIFAVAVILSFSVVVILYYSNAFALLYYDFLLLKLLSVSLGFLILDCFVKNPAENANY